tara:strand:+ start:1147 stop:1437 length:291 start_codon:yes stop_codon:yes gene_type:complete
MVLKKLNNKMSKIFLSIFIVTIKFYKFFISPILGNKCRYLPTCSDYFIDSLKIHGLLKGFYVGLKRILSCHPIKILGGGSGLDLVPSKKNNLKEKI